MTGKIDFSLDFDEATDTTKEEGTLHHADQTEFKNRETIWQYIWSLTRLPKDKSPLG